MTTVLIAGGVVLIAAALVTGFVTLSRPVEAVPERPLAEVVPTPTGVARTSVALPADRVAAVLNVDASVGAGLAARLGDHVDVLGYFSRQITGAESVTRVLLSDVPVVGVDRSGAAVALTLAVPRDAALLLQEAEALGARPFVVLLADAAQPAASAHPTNFSDADLANRLTGTH